MLSAVGIDVSKGKSTVAVLQPGSTIVRKPFDVKHSVSNLKSLKDYILSLKGGTKAVLECTDAIMSLFSKFFPMPASLLPPSIRT
jgi:transposase